jgi:hypothetical protein
MGCGFYLQDTHANTPRYYELMADSGKKDRREENRFYKTFRQHTLLMLFCVI